MRKPPAAKMGRPRGEIRHAVETWAATWRPRDESPGLTCRELTELLPGFNHRARTDVALIREAVMNACKAGTVRRVGRRAVEGANKPAVLFAPALPDAAAPGAALQALQAAWFGRPAAELTPAGLSEPVPAQNGARGQVGSGGDSENR